jgi:acetyl esterase/lipase
MTRRVLRTLQYALAVVGLFALALLVQGLVAQRKSAHPPPAQRPAVSRDIVYAVADGQELRLDAYVPPGKPESPRPIVVYIHGGAWRGGDKSGVNWLAGPLLDAGFAFFSIDYRMSYEAHFPAQIHDCKAAIRWVRTHAAEYGGDASRIGVMGTSAGAHLAALLGTSGGVKELEGTVGETGVSSKVQAVSDWFGPSDLTVQGDSEHWLVDPVSALLGARPADDPEAAAAASPVTYIDHGDPPFLIVHGTADPTVPIEQSLRLRDKLAAAGVPVDLIEVPGGGHGKFEDTSPNREELVRRTVLFFRRTLAPAASTE